MAKFRFNPQDHEYTLDGVRIPGVTEILKAEGIIDYSRVDPDTLERARILGEYVHKTTELFDKDDLDPKSIHHRVAPYLDAWAEFRVTYDLQEFIEIEEPIYSLRLRFGTIPDRIAPIDGFTIIEIKTLKTINEKASRLQTAGQKIAWEELRKGKIRNRWTVQLKDNGKCKVHTHKDRADETYFKSALNMFNLKGGKL